jgi:hypothetical protein
MDDLIKLVQAVLNEWKSRFHDECNKASQQADQRVDDHRHDSVKVHQVS